MILILSQYKGLEPECIEIGEFKDQTLIFAGLERPGSIAVFTVHDKSSTDSTPKLSLESIYFGVANEEMNVTWGEMYEQRKVHVLEVEDLV